MLIGTKNEAEIVIFASGLRRFLLWAALKHDINFTNDIGVGPASYVASSDRAGAREIEQIHFKNWIFF